MPFKKRQNPKQATNKNSTKNDENPFKQKGPKSVRPDHYGSTEESAFLLFPLILALLELVRYYNTKPQLEDKIQTSFFLFFFFFVSILEKQRGDRAPRNHEASPGED